MAALNRPARQRNLFLAAAAIAWPILAVVAWLDPVVITAGWPLWAQIVGGAVLGLGVLNAAILGPVIALIIHVESRALARLRRGEGVIARWQVTPESWRSFLASEQRLGRAGGANLLDRGMACPPEGLACVATRDSVLIGENFHHLTGMGMIGRVSWRDAPPGMLEVEAFAPRGRHGGLRSHLVRFPVGPAYKAGRDLHAAWLHRAGLIGNPGATFNALRWRNIALAGLLLGLGLAAVPIAMHGFVAALEARDTGAETLLFIPGILLIAFGLGGTLRLQLDSRRQAKVEGGKGVIGAWRLDPAAWRAFEAFDTIRRGREDVPWNLVDAARARRAGGDVVVTVAEEAVAVGEQFFHIPSFAVAGVTAVSWLDRSPACLEIRGRYRARIGVFSRFGSPVGDIGDFVIRVPVAAGAEAVARTALDTWRTRLVAG